MALVLWKLETYPCHGSFLADQHEKIRKLLLTCLLNSTPSTYHITYHSQHRLHNLKVHVVREFKVKGPANARIRVDRTHFKLIERKFD